MVAFPCNQFGYQEPGRDATEILNCIKHVRPGNEYEPHTGIQMMEKCDVNGPNEIPIYTYLKKSCPPYEEAFFKNTRSFWAPIRYNDIIWNFEKFLVSPEGVPLYRFHPWVTPLEMEELVQNLLNTDPAKPVEEVVSRLDIAVELRIKGPRVTQTGSEATQATAKDLRPTENGNKDGDSVVGGTASSLWTYPYIVSTMAVAWSLL